MKIETQTEGFIPSEFGSLFGNAMDKFSLETGITEFLKHIMKYIFYVDYHELFYIYG